MAIRCIKCILYNYEYTVNSEKIPEGEVSVHVAVRKFNSRCTNSL